MVERKNGEKVKASNWNFLVTQLDLHPRAIYNTSNQTRKSSERARTHARTAHKTI